MALAFRKLVRTLLPWLAIAGICIWLFGPTLATHVRKAADPGVFEGDARQQITPFYRFEDPSVLAGDLATDYYLACLPIGYKGLFILAAKLWSVHGLELVLPYLLLVVALTAMGLAAYRFAGKVGVLAVLLLGLGGPFFLPRAAGALPRSLGFPIAACALAALVLGRPRLLAGAVVVGAAFYPAAAMSAGLALAVWLLLLPAADRGAAADWSLRRRLAWVVGTGAVSLALLAPSAISASRYGPVIRPADVQEFPEAGPGGRYSPGDRAPFRGFLREAKHRLERRLRASGPAIWQPGHRFRRALPGALGGPFWWLLAVAAGGWALLCLRRADARRATLLVAAGFVGYHLAAWIAPLLYLPQRYVLYPVVPFADLVLAAGVVGFVPGAGGWLGRKREAEEGPHEPPPLRWWRRWCGGRRPAAVALFGIVFLGLFGCRGGRMAGLSVRVDEEAAIYRFLRALPVDARIAGWPNGMVDNVPYLTRRAALVTFETHQAFHARYTLEMRRRTEALIAAYFATGPGPLRRLREDFGVTHLLVDRPALERRELHYFEPFPGMIRQAIFRSRGPNLEVLRQLPAAVFDDGQHVVLELARLDGSGAGREPGLDSE